MTRWLVESEKRRDGRHFQYVVLKAYGANTYVLAFLSF